jgi:hypothetical protein
MRFAKLTTRLVQGEWEKQQKLLKQRQELLGGQLQLSCLDSQGERLGRIN